MSLRKKNIQNLFNKEEWIILNLKNISYQVQSYLNKLTDLKQEFDLGIHKEKADWFLKIFNYYQDDLIPALQESAAMEEKHIKILKRNPDAGFKPIQLEIEHHQHLTHQFITRFEDLHLEFHEFTVKIKTSSYK